MFVGGMLELSVATAANGTLCFASAIPSRRPEAFWVKHIMVVQVLKSTDFFGKYGKIKKVC